MHNGNLQINFILTSNLSMQACVGSKATSLTCSKISKSHDLFCNEALFVLSCDMKGIEKSIGNLFYNRWHMNIPGIVDKLYFGF